MEEKELTPIERFAHWCKTRKTPPNTENKTIFTDEMVASIDEKIDHYQNLLLNWQKHSNQTERDKGLEDLQSKIERLKEQKQQYINGRE